MSFGGALRLVREGRQFSQERLAEALHTKQPTVSKWERDEARPSLEDLAAAEEAMGVERGAVLRLAGFVEDGCSVQSAIDSAEELPAAARRRLLVAYGELVENAGR